MYSVGKIKVARWTERFIVSWANPSSLYTRKVTTPCHTLPQLQWSVRSGRMIQSLPLDVPDIDFIGSDLKPYSCHLTYRLTEAIPGHSHIYDLMGAGSSDWMCACVRYTLAEINASLSCVLVFVGVCCPLLDQQLIHCAADAVGTTRTVIWHLHCPCRCFN